MIFSSSHWCFEKSTLWALNQTWCYLEGGGVGAIYLIWLANPGLLGLTTEAQQGRMPFSPASTGAGRPILGGFAPLHGCPFIFIRTKPRSEWSSKKLALLSRAFWLYSWCTLRTLWQKLMEERLSRATPWLSQQPSHHSEFYSPGTQTPGQCGLKSHPTRESVK